MIYTDKVRPKQRSAARAWDFFKAKYGAFEEIFFNPKADFADSRAPGWTAYFGDSSCLTPYGAKAAPRFAVHSVEDINDWHDQLEEQSLESAIADDNFSSAG